MDNKQQSLTTDIEQDRRSYAYEATNPTYPATSSQPAQVRVAYNRPQPGFAPLTPVVPVSTPPPVAPKAPTSNDGEANKGLPIWPFAIAAIAGAILALVIIPAWVPTLGGSLVGSEPKGYWYIARAAGLTSFVLLWLSMASGLLITNKVARIWPGAFTAFDLHQFTSLLGLGFVAVHVAALLGDKYVPYSVFQLLVPFTSTDYRPFWVSIGQIALYLIIPVTFTFYIRKQMGNRMWHLVHLLSYAVFALSLLHGLFSGTDSGNPWVSTMYWITGASLVGLTAHRIMVKNLKPAQGRKAQPA